MNSKLYCIRDQKIGSFADPFPSPTPEVALRSLKTAVETGNSDVAKYPEDFDLYEIGAFDSETGTILAYPQPKHLSSCLAFKKLAPQTVIRDDISL